MSTKATIVLVDDSHDDLFLTKRLLAHAGIQNPIVTFDHPEAAMALLHAAASERGEALPCLVISDLRMPKIDGLDFLRWVRAQPGLKHLPFAILTGGNIDHERQKAAALKASAFLMKFPGADVLATLVKNAAEGRLDLR